MNLKQIIKEGKENPNKLSAVDSYLLHLADGYGYSKMPKEEDFELDYYF